MDNIKNGVIESVALRIERDTWLVLSVFMKFEHYAQGFQSFDLSNKNSSIHPGVWIERLLRVCGTNDFDKLPGKAVRVKVDKSSGTISSIGNIIKDEWLGVDDTETLVDEQLASITEQRNTANDLVSEYRYRLDALVKDKVRMQLRLNYAVEHGVADDLLSAMAAERDAMTEERDALRKALREIAVLSGKWTTTTDLDDLLNEYGGRLAQINEIASNAKVMAQAALDAADEEVPND